MTPHLRKASTALLNALSLLILSARPGLGQQSSADSARSLMSAAAAAAAAGTSAAYREALRLRTQALGIWRRTEDRKGEGESLSWIALSWFQLGEPDSARRVAQQAFGIRLSAGDTAGAVRTLSGVLAVAFEAAGELDSALATYYRAYQIAAGTKDPGLEARVTQNLGSFFIDHTQPDSALTWLWRTVALTRQARDQTSEAETLNNIGVLYLNLGSLDSALAYVQRAIEIGRARRSDSLLASAFQNLGNTFRAAGQPDSALAYYHLGLASARRARPPEVRQALLDIGIILSDLGQGDSALVYWRQALAQALEFKDLALEGRVWSNFGVLYTERHQTDSARAAFQRVLAIYRPLGLRRGEGIVLLNLANVHLLEAHNDSTLRYGRQALEIARELEFPALESSALNAIGQAFQNLGEPDSALRYLRQDLALSRKIDDARGTGNSLLILGLALRDQRKLAAAIAYFDSSAAVKRRLARNAGGDFNRTTLGEREFELYDVWTRTWLGRAAEVGARAAALGALGASEQGRAQALLDLMNRAAGDSSGTFDAVASAERLVRGATAKGTALLQYHLSADTLIIWTAAPGQDLRVQQVAVSQDSLARLIAELRRALGAEEGVARIASRGALEPGLPSPATRPAAWEQRADALGAVLLPSAVRHALAGSREVLIVPHGTLALVPFTLLPWDNSGRLGDNTSVRYSPSLATALAAEQRPVVRLRPALVLGNPFMPQVTGASGERLSLGSLPGAEQEAQEIAARLGTTAWRGNAATETALRRELPGVGLIHLATHGYAYANEGQARNSFVALGPDALNDGLLTVGELLDDPALQLNAELVTLSACQSGLGDLKQAEGTIGLQRAFLARGARSVLVSLWSVSDLATRLLMDRFYAHLLNDSDQPSKALALQRAQREVRATSGFAHPRFWAAFQLVGAP